MGHAKIDNKSRYVFEALYLVDEDFRPLLVAVLKATFSVGKHGRCTLAERQVDLNLGGEHWGEDPENSSYKYEPEVAFVKPATDVVLVGHAHAPRSNTTEMQVQLQAGKLRKDALVTGDRLWYKAAGAIVKTRPAAFEKIPLCYERAFGGWDRDHPDRNKHSCEPRNPVGTGYRAAGGFKDGIRLPNIEDPRAPISEFVDRPTPVGFGFVSPHWKPRADLVGTYDAAWQKQRSPLLPKDFDRRHLNAASPGLIASGHLRGDESVAATGVTPEGKWSVTLPGVRPPSVTAILRDGQRKLLSPVLDTVILEPDEQRVQMLWRSHLTLRTGPHDVSSVEVSAEPTQE
jgi:hypothetical protein